MKEFFEHYSGLKAAKDGEIFVPMCQGHTEHYTYGWKKTDGHRAVNYQGKSYLVHKLVAEVFLNNNKPIDGSVYAVHHINESPEDNRVENLVILTIGEHHRLHRTGSHFNDEAKRKMSEAKKGKYGAKCNRSIPIIGVNKTTGKELKFSCAAEAKRVLGISRENICNCCNGRLKSAGGYLWRYA